MFFFFVFLLLLSSFTFKCIFVVVLPSSGHKNERTNVVVYILVFYKTVSCLGQKLICSGSKTLSSRLRWCWKRGCRSREERGSSFTSCCPVIVLQVQPAHAHKCGNSTAFEMAFFFSPLPSSVRKVWHAGASDKPRPHPAEPQPGGEDGAHWRLPACQSRVSPPEPTAAQTESNQVGAALMWNVSTSCFFWFSFLIIMRNQEIIIRLLFVNPFRRIHIMFNL